MEKNELLMKVNLKMPGKRFANFKISFEKFKRKSLNISSGISILFL